LPADKENDSDLTVLKIGQQAFEIDFSGGAQQGGTSEHKEMMDRMYDLPVARQYPILSLANSTDYYQAQEFSEADLVYA
jgi:hypothetical protein